MIVVNSIRYEHDDMFISWLKSLSFHVRPKSTFINHFGILVLHYQFGITMATFGGYDYAGQQNPFAMPDPTNAKSASANRHGSAEQVGAAQPDSNDTYLGSIGEATPRATSPRSPRGVRGSRARARSEAHVREEDEDYYDRRAGRQ